jgi:hypothetical protein
MGSSFIRKGRESRFKIPIDKMIFKKLLKDADSRRNEFSAIDHWLYIFQPEEIKKHSLTEILSDDRLFEIYCSTYSTLEKVLDPWIGVTGMSKQMIDSPAFKACNEFFSVIGNSYFFDLVKQYEREGVSILNSDMWTAMDLTFLAPLIEESEAKVRILEIGPGYGRIVEALFGLYGNKVQFVLVDAVPSSLYYCDAYLRSAFPELKIGSTFVDGAGASPEDFDCFIIPSWEAHEYNLKEMDISINIESLQEMNEERVTSYLKFMDGATKDEGHVYMSNSKEYVYKGDWKVPKSWDLEVKTRTPRSWTFDHPMEIYRKAKSSSERISPIEQTYRWGLQEQRNLIKNAEELQNKIWLLESELKRAQIEARTFQDAIEGSMVFGLKKKFNGVKNRIWKK